MVLFFYTGLFFFEVINLIVYKECGPLEEEATVIGILNHSFDVLLVSLGITKRIYTDKLDLVPESVRFEKNGHKPEISFVWNKTEKHTEKVNQKVELFSTVNVRLSKHDNDPLKINVAMIKLLQIFYPEFYLVCI